MSYVLSIDVGTSFTSAAVARTDGRAPDAPQILSLGSRAASIPTVVFIGGDGTRLVGEAADRRGLSHPECVTREFKRRMGDDVPLMVGGSEILPQDLLAAVITWVVGVATEREGSRPDVVTLTHPVSWGNHRTSLLSQAVSGTGLGEVVLMSEPEAAALSYASREQVARGSTLAVYDLGGGTFDATVVRKTDDDAFTVLGTPQGLERLGGADFDQEIFDSVLDSAGITLAELEPSAEVIAALNGLRRECAEAKEALSTDTETSVSVMVPGSHAQVRLVRSEFETMIQPALAETVGTMRTALEIADVRAEDLTAILLIGGSSRIPLVAQILSDGFNRPLAIDLDPKASVALGAAFATAALEDAPDIEESLAPGALGAAAALGETQESGVRTRGTNAAGFALSRGKPASSPRHGPASRKPNRRLGLRVGAIAAAVALLGVATATATNAPNPIAALSGLAGDQRAEAAEEPLPAEESLPDPVTGTSDAGPSAAWDAGAVGPLVDTAGGGTFLDRVTDLDLNPQPEGSDEARSADTTPSRAPARTGDTRDGSGPRTTTKEAPQESPLVEGETLTRSGTSDPTVSAPKPGTSAAEPTPPAPFPSPSPEPASPDPVADAPTTPAPAPDPTPAPAPEPPELTPEPAAPTPAPVEPTPEPPVGEPVAPPAPEPSAEPPAPPSPDPQPTTADPAPEPTTVDPTPGDPPPPDGSTPSAEEY